jgi:hypothetical protein
MEKVSLPLTKGTTIVVESGVKHVKAEAKFGKHIAVHRAFDPDKGWAISHVPTGLAITFVGTKEIAMQCAEECAQLDWSSLNIIDCFGKQFLEDVRYIIGKYK